MLSVWNKTIMLSVVAPLCLLRSMLQNFFRRNITFQRNSYIGNSVRFFVAPIV